LLFFSFGGYGLALAALLLLVFGAYDSYPDYWKSFCWFDSYVQPLHVPYLNRVKSNTNFKKPHVNKLKVPSRETIWE